MKPNKDTVSCNGGKCKMGRFRCKLVGASILLLVGLSIAAWFFLHNSDKKPTIPEEDTFSQAVILFNENKLDDAQTAFERVLSHGKNSDLPLSRMYIATLLEKKNDISNAITKFLEIAHDNSIPPVIRYVANIRAAWLSVDTAPHDDIIKMLQKLSDPSNPMYYSAQEIIGLSALKSGDIKKAKGIFEAIKKDPKAPSGVADRSQMILSNITSTYNM
ncbi:MAG: hypothetical protein EU981_01850 [Candidatus Liberibacter ctenarytainae]|uniref:Tetratricopeptide repeat-like domain-containing protein n=1 Tax=Candidatus Liberibacter ctenarytainae TaxID=2020335 RepID=A0A937DLR3_9HYPH|nr:hypothetical protein [Candidatus Liberibacter ctenarytainae]